MAGRAGSERQSTECDNAVKRDEPAPVEQTLCVMHEWIYTYVSQNLHYAAPLEDFTDRLRNRLEKIFASNPACCPRTAVSKAVIDLVHDLNRTTIRQEARFVPCAAFDDIVDKRSDVEITLIEEGLKRARQARAVTLLCRLRGKDRDLVEQVFGMAECEVARAQIAKELGVKRNSIDQRIRRILQSIRETLEK